MKTNDNCRTVSGARDGHRPGSVDVKCFWVGSAYKRPIDSAGDNLMSAFGPEGWLG